MAEYPIAPDQPASPLEAFLRAYLEASGGVWDEIEPQVYDVLVPAADGGAGEVARVAFDPEALPEHPSAQLASFGTPFIDRLLHDAVRRGRSSLAYLVGLNLEPHDLAGRCQRALKLAPPLELHMVRARALHFTQAVFWFQAEFISDQKEQDIIPVAMDLHYAREVRHLEKLLDHSRLAEQPALPLPEARRQGVASAYRVAREQVLRTVATMAHGRSRELGQRLEHQAVRLRQYYADLRNELDEQSKRSRNPEEAAVRLVERRAALEREERLRLVEMQDKSRLRAHLRLLQLLLIQQPKLLLQATATAPKHTDVPLELVWDPLAEALEAPACPHCGHPSYTFKLGDRGQFVCPACEARDTSPPRKASSR